MLLDKLPRENEILLWNNKILSYKVFQVNKPDDVIIFEDYEKYIVYSEDGKHSSKDAEEIHEKEIYHLLNLENLK